MENQRLWDDDGYLEKWENDGELENKGRLWRTKEYGKMMENQRIWEDDGELENLGR